MSHHALSNTNGISVIIKPSSSSTLCILLWTWNVSPVSIRIWYFFCKLQIQKHQHTWRLLHCGIHVLCPAKKRSPISTAMIPQRPVSYLTLYGHKLWTMEQINQNCHIILKKYMTTSIIYAFKIDHKKRSFQYSNFGFIDRYQRLIPNTKKTCSFCFWSIFKLTT